MRSQTNRKAIIISALLTAFVLTLVTGGRPVLLPLCRRCPWPPP